MASAKRWLAQRHAPVELTDEIAALIRARVRSDWIEPRFQRVVDGPQLAVPLEPAADLVEFDRPDGAIRRRIADLDRLLDDTNARLLIVGDAGSGETVLAMRLAGLLCDRSEREPAVPVPVVLSVSSWDPDRYSTLAIWVGEQVERVYGAARAEHVERWLRAVRLALVLDGLDELVPAERRDLFLAQLNTFATAEGHTLPVVLTCREADRPETTVARLRHAVRMCPLTPAQVGGRLAQLAATNPAWDEVRLLTNERNDISRAIAVPLYLDLMTSVPPVAIASALRSTTSQDDVERELARLFVEQRISPLGPQGRSSLEVVATWLAQASSDRAVFYIDGITPRWLRRRLTNCLAWAMAFGLAFGLVAGLTTTEVRSEILGLLVGLVGGLVLGLIMRPDSRAHVVTISIGRVLRWAPGMTLGGLLVGLLWVACPGCSSGPSTS